MKLTVLGGCGAWPAAGQACSGYLVEADSFRLLIDPGYASFPRLLETTAAEEIDAVLVSHGHPDHTADLNPLLRARVLGETGVRALPIHALPGAVDPVLALDRPGMLAHGFTETNFDTGDVFELGPFRVKTRALPHSLPNAGLRLAVDDVVLAYTGDTGPSPDVVDLARNADLFLAEATFAERVPDDSAATLSSALQAGEYAAGGGAGRLLLTHLSPGTDPGDAIEMAARSYHGDVSVARGGLTVVLE